ncbi:hypothetical protein HNE05_03585 [Aquipseudomonas campi]|uniref:Uncharacterized protein n=1 Tax=Aquipseudomonas campi TaxID=2731681 RepID=A0A6M8FC81_9GAMM|nr:hypothetical protein [Pseudomonas campi]QKE62477.1 hypothetical protein HNE05_03585 [Pseudomonas campi]
MTNSLTVLEIVGPWSGEATTSLMQRCKAAWNVPLTELSDHMVATFLEQRIAIPEVLAEAERRLVSEERDETELFEGQLNEAVHRARGI